MKKHLFIKAPIQSGKSTLLQDAILPYGDVFGGFVSQRLKDEEGNTRGFRLADMAEHPALTAPFSPDLPDIFMLFGENKKIDLSVFEHRGTAILRSALQSKKIILLDEIGGIDLLSPGFRKALYDALERKSCIGILKLPMYMNHFTPEVEKENKHLIYFLDRYDTIEIDFNRSMYSSQKHMIQEFIEGSLLENEF